MLSERMLPCKFCNNDSNIYILMYLFTNLKMTNRIKGIGSYNFIQLQYLYWQRDEESTLTTLGYARPGL